MIKEQRACAIVMRHLSGIQKGIQADHAGDELAIKHWENPQFQRWIRKDKTLYVLEANTGDQLMQAYKELKKLNVPLSLFREPDLYNIVTAIRFIMDEPVWNAEKYPDGLEPKDLAIRRIKNRFKLASN
jgi:hypothetical protein